MIRMEGVPAGRKLKNPLLQKMKRQKVLLLITIPVIAYVFVFSYLPVVNWLWAFFDYKAKIGVFQANFAGLKYFRELFFSEGFWIALRNTLVMSFLDLSLGTVFAVVFALMINEMRYIRFKRIAQTVSYLPHFISWVIVASIFTNLLRINGGVVNDLLVKLGVIQTPIPFLLTGWMYWPLVVVMSTWKEIGWAAILYLAAMTGINEELYEAAYADGAGRMKRIWHVTLPGIRETIVVLLIMKTGWVLATGLEQGLLFSNGANLMYSDVISTYTIRYGLKMGRISYAMAANMFQSLAGFGLVLISNYVSRKTLGTSLF